MRLESFRHWRLRFTHENLRGLKFVSYNVAFLGLLYVALVGPIENFFEKRAHEIQDRAHTRSRYHVFLQRQTNHAINATDHSEELFQDAGDGRLDAAVQTLLKQKVEAAGARLFSTRSLPPKIENGIYYAVAHLECAGSVSKIQATLRAIETNIPYLFIGKASFSSSPSAIVASQIEAGEPEVQTQLDVYAPVDRGETHG